MELSSRAELRRILRRRRDAIPAMRRSRGSLTACRAITLLDCYASASRIGAYLAHQSELDPAPFLNQASASGKELYVPRVLDGKRMTYVHWTPSTKLDRNRYGICEPQNSAPVEIELLDLVLVPLLGFDAKGNRLGSGAGYYDRSFHFKRESPECRPILIGLAYDEQMQDGLTRQPWDVPLDYVITETQQIQTRR